LGYIVGPAAGVGNTPRLRGDVISKFSRFSESEFKNEETVHVVHSEWLLFHCDAYLSSFCDVKKNLNTSDRVYVEFVTNLVEKIQAAGML